MNKNMLRWVLLIAWTAGLYFVLQYTKPKPAPPPPPEQRQDFMRAELAKEEAAGGNTADLEKILKDYNNFAKDRRYAGTKEAAEAGFRAAVIQEKLKKYSHAANQFKTLAAQYKSTQPEIAKEARINLARLQKDIDKRNSTQLGYKMIDWLVRVTGKKPAFSYALALLIITIVIKVLTTPLSHIQYKSMKEMQKIQPLLKQVQEKYKGDQKVLGEKTMALYKEHGVNPFTGCLPMLVQMPLLILLYYKVILAYQYQFVHGQFLWIGSALSHKYPSILAINFAEPDIPLLLIYAVSMYLSQKLTVVDPSQAQQQKIMAIMMPLLFTWMSWKYAFPSALMFYWLLFNIFSTWQQWSVMKQPSAPLMPKVEVVPAEGNGSKAGAAPKAIAPTAEAGKTPQVQAGSKSGSGAKRRRKKK